MVYIPKKVVERLSRSAGKFQKVLGVARDRDINEADTVLIVGDILSEVFGFDKYLEVTSEFSIRNTYCDLAIKLDGKTQYLIEVKAIGLDLKENHLQQAVNYGANHGVQWVVLTNGIIWEIYRIKFERPISHDLVCTINFPELNPRKASDQEKLFLLCKEGLEKAAREEFHERIQSVNRFVISALILNDSIMSGIRRDLRKLTPGLKVELPEIEKILRNEVLKRDAIEGEAADKAQARIKKLNRPAKKPKTKPEPEITKEPSTFSENNS